MRCTPVVFSGLILLLSALATLPVAAQHQQVPPKPMFAQGDWPQEPGPGDLMNGGMRGRGKGRHLEQLRLLKLLELLDLGEDQEVEFITRFRIYRKSLQAANKEREGHITRLAEGLGADQLTDAEINDLIGLIREGRHRLQLESERFIDDCRGLLTAQQLGKLVVFDMKFERELLGRLRVFREKGLQRRMHEQPSKQDEKP